jgi:tetratricopeptide (TPR) repeat protein
VVAACNLLAQDRAADCVTRAEAPRENGEYDKAIEDYTRAIQFDPRNAVAYQGHARTWQEKGDYDETVVDHNGLNLMTY